MTSIPQHPRRRNKVACCPRGHALKPPNSHRPHAGVVELADTPDLGSGGASRGGSSPSARTSLRVRREGFLPLMQVTETLSEGLKRGYTVVVPANDLEARRQAKLSDLARDLRLPGFRPGKVPASVVRQRYGTAVVAEVLQESVSEATEKVVSERGLRPAVPPKVDVVAPGLGPAESRDLEFKVELELLPEIRMPDFAAI